MAQQTLQSAEPYVEPPNEMIMDQDVQAAQGARPTTDANVVIQVLAGIVGTVVVSWLVGPLKGSKFNYFWELIRDRGPIQYIMLFMAFMVAAQIFLKIRILRNQLLAIARSPVDSSIDLNDDVQIQELRKATVDNPLYSHSIMLSRLDRILAMWLATKDISRVSSWVGSESARDSSASDSSYALARVLIWAIPILGFIGTVQGLGNAVSSFSSFLAGAAELSQIKDAIMNVTIGLGVAFDTTFLALILVTFLMFPLSSLQRREESLFVEIDIYLDDALISRLPSPESKPIVIENLEDSIEAAFRRYIPDPDRYDEVFTRSIERAAGTVEERFDNLMRNYELALRDLAERLSSSIGAAGNSIEEAMRKVAGEMRAQDEEVVTARRELGQEELARMSQILETLNTAAAEVAQQYQQSIAGLQETTRQSADKTMNAVETLSEKMGEIARLAAGVQELLKIEQAVEEGLRGISASDEFRSTMAQLREHLATTDAFCSRLSKPRVITLREEVTWEKPPKVQVEPS